MQGKGFSTRRGKQALASVAAFMLLAVVMAVAPTQTQAGLIGSGNAGRCEALTSEGVESFCGGAGNGGCSCQAGCVAAGNCCDDYLPVCLGNFQCAPDSGQIAFMHMGGMCSTKWDYAGESDAVADVSAIAGAVSIDVHAVQTSSQGTQVAARTLARYLDACCTNSNSCVIYNYSNGDNVVGYTLDQLASTTTVCNGGNCQEVLDWNILEVRTAAGNGGGSALSNWGAVADLFGCDLSSQIGPTQSRSLYDHNNTQGVPVRHVGGFLDQVSGSDQLVLDAGWFLLPWHNDGAVGYHSAGARNTAVEWCGDGNNLSWDWDYFGNWCQDEDLCSSNYGTMFSGHSMAFCPMLMENSDHYDQKMAYIALMGQTTACATAADCDDANPCTTDTCNNGGLCVHAANNSTCTDDGNPCTDDYCDGATNCVHPDNSAACDDGDPATTGDVCSAGLCLGEVRCGDVNADGGVSVVDALLVAQYSVGLRGCASIAAFDRCDVNPPGTQDNACTISDALRMAQCSVGLVSCDMQCSPLVCG